MFAAFLIALGAIFRVVPHPANVAPVGALAVLAGRTMRPWMAIAVTLAAMALSDVALAQIHGWPMFGLGTVFVYGGFVAQVLIARALRQRRGGAIGAAVLGALAFFAISNLGVWVVGGMYAMSAAGLVECYTAALPFLERTMIGDVAWTIALVLLWHSLAPRRELRPAHAF